MRLVRLALLPVGVALGLAAESASHASTSLEVADFAVGCVLIGCGVVAWDRRRESRVGVLMVLAGYTWFLGNFWAPFLYLHRGPLVHLHLSYPTGRLTTRLARAVVVAAYVDAAIEPVARVDWLTLALSVGVGLAAVQVFARTTGPARKAGGPALAAALAFAGVLALGALDRMAGWGLPVLWIYDAVIASVAIVLLVDLLRGRWTEAVVTGLVVDLGAPGEVGTLRTKLARALGDPSLVVGYRVPDAEAFVDDAGLPVELPASGSGRIATSIEDEGEHLAVLVHDEALLAEPKLLQSVAAAARVAVANAGLQAEARARAEELEASRRRIVEAADAQRRRLERELRLGAERRLETVDALLSRARSEALAGDAQAIATLETELDETRRELREFAHGVHPAALTEEGLMAALELLAERSTIPTALSGEVPRLRGAVEAALFFVCSEALANAAKHAEANNVRIGVSAQRERVVAVVVDDGIGGADVRAGSGLSGLVDRVEALGGQLDVDSPAGAGTRVVAEIPMRVAIERARTSPRPSRT